MNGFPGSSVSLRQDYLAGMPQLARTGLSENWLLKECGHQHWLLLAQLHGREVPSFTDREGRTAYAAFTAIRLRNLQLETVGENARLQLRSQLQRAGRARHYSEHRLLADGCPCGSLEMLSTFVCRHSPGDNRSAVRAQFATPESDPPEPCAPARALLEAGKQWRDSGSDSSALEYRFSPCPELDFNGAEFLYFAQFQAVVERAEWALLIPPVASSCRERELYFYANLNAGDSLVLRLCPTPERPLQHRCEVRRSSDGRKLAEIFTHKQCLEPS